MVSTAGKNNSSFKPITADDISQQTKRLDINKAIKESDIPTKPVKRFDNLIVDYLQENFNNCLNPNKAGLFEGGFFSGGGGQFDSLPSPLLHIPRRTYLISI